MFSLYTAGETYVTSKNLLGPRHSPVTQFFLFTPLPDQCSNILKNMSIHTYIGLCREFISIGATALQGFGWQSGRRRSAKLVPNFADKGVSRGQRNGSPRPLISVYRTWIATYFIQVAPQLTSRGSRGKIILQEANTEGDTVQNMKSQQQNWGINC